LERQGDAIRFHPTLLEFARHYRYEPRPVAPARSNEKGRVERAIRYVRESFFAARAFADLADLNAQASLWCNGQAADRICPADRELRVREAFAHEQLQLLPLPDYPFVTDEVVAVHVGKTPYARFDLNDYSVPHAHVQRTVTVRATPDRVRILDGLAVIADHPRCYDRAAQIEDPIMSPHSLPTSAMRESIAAQIGSPTRCRPARNCSCAQRHAAAIWAPSPWDCCACWIGSVPPSCKRRLRTRSRMERRIRIPYASRSNEGGKRVRHRRRLRLTYPNTYAPKTLLCNSIYSRHMTR
jgi:hypothetical protein